MNVYQKLNEVTSYIDIHLEDKIDVEVLARMVGVNEYTFLRLFSLLTNYTLSEYIRMRKLSCAGLDLYNEDCFVLDVALKYGYENATSFSRAFTKFHGIKPSKIKDIKDLRIFPRLVFDTNVPLVKSTDFEVVEWTEGLTLYGISVETDNEHINADAPKLFKEASLKYEKIYGAIKYAIVLYEDETREECTSYCVLFEKKVPGSKKYIIPKGKYLSFKIGSQEAGVIQEISRRFYFEILPSCKYNLRGTPEVEYYHDDVCEFFVPIC
ncbi:MAG TPA: hypothetical protein DCY94_04065 [Firmicutes bacterium]|nr:hypothetical protein [Bacillota bacterium]